MTWGNWYFRLLLAQPGGPILQLMTNFPFEFGHIFNLCPDQEARKRTAIKKFKKLFWCSLNESKFMVFQLLALTICTADLLLAVLFPEMLSITQHKHSKEPLSEILRYSFIRGTFSSICKSALKKPISLCAKPFFGSVFNFTQHYFSCWLNEIQHKHIIAHHRKISIGTCLNS